MGYLPGYQEELIFYIHYKKITRPFRETKTSEIDQFSKSYIYEEELEKIKDAIRKEKALNKLKMLAAKIEANKNRR